jgi:hypothetical protein
VLFSVKLVGLPGFSISDHEASTYSYIKIKSYNVAAVMHFLTFWMIKIIIRHLLASLHYLIHCNLKEFIKWNLGVPDQTDRSIY